MDKWKVVKLLTIPGFCRTVAVCQSCCAHKGRSHRVDTRLCYHRHRRWPNQDSTSITTQIVLYHHRNQVRDHKWLSLRQTLLSAVCHCLRCSIGHSLRRQYSKPSPKHKHPGLGYVRLMDSLAIGCERRTSQKRQRFRCHDGEREVLTQCCLSWYPKNF